MKGRFDDGGRKGDGGSGGEGAYKSDYGIGKRALTRRRFVKTTAAFGAAVAGIPPYNLTDIADLVLKEDGELIMYPHLHRFINKIFQVVNIKLWGCNWNCQCCINKYPPFKDLEPMGVTVDEIIDLTNSVCLDSPIPTLFAVSGGEPLLQREEVFGLIKSLKERTDYIVELSTNGSLVDEAFIDRANDLGLDRINTSFRSLDDNWHKRYTGGHSIQTAIDALKLVTEKFNGLSVVSTTLFPEIKDTTFETMCMFLKGINPDFLMRISCPYNDKHDCDDCFYMGRINKIGEIAAHYFHRVMPDPYDFDKFLADEMSQYKLGRVERGQINLVKIWEWKKGKGVVTYG